MQSTAYCLLLYSPLVLLSCWQSSSFWSKWSSCRLEAFVHADRSHSWGLCPHHLITSQIRSRLQTPPLQRLGFNTWILGDTNIQTDALPRPFSSEELGAPAQIWTALRAHSTSRAPHGVSWGYHWGCVKAQLLPLPNLDSSPLPPIGVDSKGTP